MTMTDDLATRLRDFDPNWDTWEVVEEAAERIYALTADRENRLADLRIIKAERDNLKREVAISDALLISEAEASLERLARAEKAEADNARLREALQVYANSCDATETSPCGYEGNMCCHTARAALNTGKEPSHE
jgi:hypothetical protein